MSVHRAMQEISSPEFTEWQAYYQLEPFGDQIADLRHGVLCSLLANLKRDSKAKPDPYKPEDFIYWVGVGQSVDDDESDLVLLDDPVEQSNLIRAAIFGKA